MITRVEEGEAVVQGDEVVRALLTAMATLEDLVEVGHESHSALSTLEDIAHELGRMDSGERRRFIEVLERIAAEEPGRAAWIRGIPNALGLDR
ncbi:hypothetical protein [Streptomyces sp. NPDC059909]|uniref:hypothetical protein n=1 Tax=Streptomyces sp. NPDC059909 TaxID=3346998 RepID=UPI0036599B08